MLHYWIFFSLLGSTLCPEKLELYYLLPLVTCWLSEIEFERAAEKTCLLNTASTSSDALSLSQRVNGRKKNPYNFLLQLLTSNGHLASSPKPPLCRHKHMTLLPLLLTLVF